MVKTKKTFLEDLLKDHKNALDCPSNDEVINFFENLLSFLFPDYGNMKLKSKEEINAQYTLLTKHWNLITEARCKKLSDKYPAKSEVLFDEISNIRFKLLLDVKAIYEGDPAAKSEVEIIKTYPGFKAIAAYRIANCLYRSNYVLIARIISEYAHSRTGIDIHPGATIGDYFCIDHGTGIVIGETSHLGEHVKVYQGVTLGATSVRKEDASKKRHPTIEDNVVIYANSTILGGKTVIGKNSIIGGNSWITKSLAPNSRLSYDSENKYLHKVE